MTKDKIFSVSEKEVKKQIDKLADNNLWMNCTFKKMDKDGNYVKCAIKVLKQNIDKKNHNNNYCLAHQEFINNENKKRRQTGINDFIDAVRCILSQMPSETFTKKNKDDILNLLNHANKNDDGTKKLTSDKLKENIINYLNSSSIPCECKTCDEYTNSPKTLTNHSFIEVSEFKKKLNGGEFDARD